MADNEREYFLKNLIQKKKSILLSKDEVTIGRGPNMGVCLFSVMISKHHATIKKTDDGIWTITDENSMNGVYVNNKRLPPNIPCPLTEKDIIVIGKSKDMPTAYELTSRPVMKCKEKKLEPKASPSSCSDSIILKDSSRISPSQHNMHSPNPGPSSSNSDSKDCIVTGMFNRKRSFESNDEKQKLLDYEKKMKMLQKRLKESEEALQKERDLRTKQAHVIESLSSEVEKTKTELEDVQDANFIDKLLYEEELKQKAETALQEKEKLLWSSLEEKERALNEEKESIEKELREKDMANKVEYEKLLESKKRLEKDLANKETEKILLRQQLDEAKETSEKEKESALKMKETVLSDFADLMETELQCSVCGELFVQATTLNCSHSFCTFCIEEWMKRKKECPVCRQKVTSQARALVLDSYIDKMVACFSEEKKKAREEIVKERKVVACPPKKAKVKRPVNNSHQRGLVSSLIRQMNSNNPHQLNTLQNPRYGLYTNAARRNEEHWFEEIFDDSSSSESIEELLEEHFYIGY